MIERQKPLYLCRPNDIPIAQLNGVNNNSVNYSVRAKSYNEINFTVDEYVNVNGTMVKSNGYDNLKIGMHILLPGCDVFEMQEPVVSNDGYKETKTIHAYSLEHQFQEKSWVGVKVNIGTTDSLEYNIPGNLDDFGHPIDFITFYQANNSGKTDYSLIHRILEKMPGWSVDDNDIDGNLWDKKINLDEDNINLYGLLTSVIGPKAECIFLFDTINKKLKAIGKSSLDESTFDTSIFISMRNLMQQIDMETNEDSVYTAFNVAGGEETINIAQVNYGMSYIYDLSYFMAEPWMTNAMVQKLTLWKNWCDSNRDLYISWQKEVENIQTQMDELMYLCPNDGDDWQQWDEMDSELLQKTLDMYESYLTALRKQADSDPSYTEDGDYIPRTSGGEIDEEYYENQLKDSNKGYYTYLEIRDYIIPNIKTAQYNKGKTDDEKHDYVKEYESNWPLYGIQILKDKQESYLQQFEILSKYSKDWGDLTIEDWDNLTDEDWNTLTTDNWQALTQEERASHPLHGVYDIKHNQYIQIKSYLGDYDEATDTYSSGSLREYLQELQNQYDELEAKIPVIKEKIQLANKMADITNQETVTLNGDINENWILSDEELVLFTELCKFTDYTNSNIILTDINNRIDRIDKDLELYEDAVSKLSEVSQPQYSFNVNMDNFFDIKAFSSWKNNFELLNFMRVGLRDDYSIKLRLIGYTTNPCEIDSMLSVEFSNFITSKSGRSDLTELLDLQNNSPSNNSISVGTGSSKDATEYATTLFNMLSRSGLLSSGNIRNTAQTDATYSAFSGVSIANLVKLYSTTGYVTDMTMSEVKVTDYIDAVKVNTATLQAGTIIADRFLLKGSSSGIFYQLNNSGGLQSEVVDTLDGYVLTDRTINADKIIANSITANEITTDNISGTNGWINFHDGTFLYRSPSDNTKYLSWDGSTLAISGEIYARDGGDIGGFKISTTANTGTTAQGGHRFPNSLYHQTSNENYEFETGITNGLISGNLLPTQKAFYIKRITKDTIWANAAENNDGTATDSDMFFVRHDGLLYAKNAEIEGKIIANDGMIGTWIIPKNVNQGTTAQGGHFYGNNSLYGHASGGGYEYETGMKVESTPDTLAFYVKRIPTGDSWNHLGENTEDIFYVKHSGELYAKNANIEGNITAKSGFIGKDATHDGWTIKSNAIYSGTSALTGTGSTTAGTYIGTDGILNYKDSNAYVKITQGKITANSADITGSIKATDITAKNTYYINNSSGTKKIALNAPEASFGNALNIGDGFTGTHINGYVFTGNDLRVGEDGGANLFCGEISSNDVCYIRKSSDSDGDNISIRCSYEKAGTSYKGSGIYNETKNDWIITQFQFPETYTTGSYEYQAGDVYIPHPLWTRTLCTNNASATLGTSYYTWKTLYISDSAIHTSDRKLKDEISDISFATDLIMSLNPITFMWKDGDHRRKRMGFIAQDVAQVCNDIGENLSLVTASYKNKQDNKNEYFGENVDDEILNWGLSYEQLIAPTIKVVQDLYNQIQQLNQEIIRLKNQISDLKSTR